MLRTILVLTLMGLPTTAGGCRPTDAESPAGSVRIDDVPHIRQRPDFCGEACAAMFLRKLGSRADQDHVFDLSGLDPALGRGCHTRELGRALGKLGFRTGDVWYRIDAARSRRQLEEHFRALRDDLHRGVPSIVCMRYDGRRNASEHFRLVLGHDVEKDEVIYHEPAVADGAYRRMKRARFLDLWPLKYERQRWTLIRFRLDPERVEPGDAATTFTPADFAQHVMKLKKKLESRAPGTTFTIVVEPPFVVIGDEAPAAVRRRSVRTVRWAVNLLKKSYFDRDPLSILDVWLFRDRDSYQKHARSIFGDSPSTPFGYYSRQHGALIMNIGTGGGTLVHEIVHPFMESNFPECPAWFNEGLGSLYEQSAERGGRIQGLTNWRLAGLQKAIRARKVPSFRDLAGTSSHEFYREDRGTNYGQARYLCYYLQEKGLLEKFYREFLASHEEDPTGYRSLRKVLGVGEDGMDAFQRKWEEFVLGLRFP